MKQITTKQKLRYAFDNSMSKGPIAMIAWLALVSLVIILIAGVILSLFGIAQGEDSPAGFIENSWMSLMRTLDAGTMGGDAGWPFRIVMLLVTIGGIFIVSTLIGILSSGLESQLDELRKGRSFVIEENHTLILGWSSKVYAIINELVIANESEKKACVVILADRDKVEMEDDIRSHIDDLKTTRVICRSGNPNDMVDLDISNPYASKSIIILAPEEGNADSQTIKTILAITNNPGRRDYDYHIVAEIRDEKNLAVAKMVGKDEVELLLTDDLISRIMVQTCRQSGLSIVYSELMGFDGDEMYIAEEPSIVGMEYGKALYAYSNCAVVGLQYKDGGIQVNPPMDYVIQQGDKIIAIAEDDSTLKTTHEKYTLQEHAIVNLQPEPNKPERTLLLGWNNRAPIIIKELNNYVVPGSSIKVVSTFDVRAEIDEIYASLTNMEMDYLQADTTDRQTLDNLTVTGYDHILLLSYKENMDEQEADAQALITLLHLRNISEITSTDLSIVSEMMNVRNRDLAEVTKADDFIVSDKLISLLMSQVSENKHIMRVYEDLFQSEGSEIYLKPANTYIKPGEQVNFYTVMESAKAKGETAIGYRIIAEERNAKAAYGVKVNPVKSDPIIFNENDKIIVLAED
jgi:K+/H+ antiporter YhaU regulatory subunit KhtT